MSKTLTWVDDRSTLDDTLIMVGRLSRFRCCSCGYNKFIGLPENLPDAIPPCAWFCIHCNLTQIDPPDDITRCIGCDYLVQCLGMPRINFVKEEHDAF